MRCRLLLPMCAVSVCLSVTRLNSALSPGGQEGMGRPPSPLTVGLNHPVTSTGEEPCPSMCMLWDEVNSPVTNMGISSVGLTTIRISMISVALRLAHAEVGNHHQRIRGFLK